eukprot:gnl/MRDRNA2_/MRDRNA2_111124_c0_seq1.p1 gnl/MRDRNA2_/MRDRNA2_111124_c0~~gnl/MRDRNA2_/MRDRNA2_111124_c0_seq1.p1  ORF type:complete len:312 (-),score=55.31 gnl/MRDRNA2_/MRDRNA2_111124_c0_seq1:72-1007(-)
MTSSMTSHLGQKLPSLPVATALSSRVIRVLGLNPSSMTLQGTNCYLVGTGKQRILIDTGEGKPGFVDVLRSAMQNAGCESLQEIIVTHWHHDHLGGVPSVLDAFGPVPVRRFVVDGGIPVQELGPYEIIQHKGLVPLVDNEIIHTNGSTLRVLHTPGHTSDHVSLYLEEEAALFTGDNVLGIGSAVFTDLHAYLSSLQRMQQVAGSGSKLLALYPAHGPAIDGPGQPEKKLAEYVDHRMKRIKAIEQIISDGNSWKLSSITAHLYQDENLPNNLVKMAEMNTLMVLQKLEKDGTVAQNTDGCWAATVKSAL